MIKLILILIISILIQSCFSYREVENNSSQYVIGKTYRMQLDKKRIVVNIKSKTDSTLFVVNKFEKQNISINSISKVEKRKFSIVKTVLIVAISTITIGIIIASAVSVDLSNDIQSPN